MWTKPVERVVHVWSWSSAKVQVPHVNWSTEESELKASTWALGKGQGVQASTQVCQTGTRMLLISISKLRKTQCSPVSL